MAKIKIINPTTEEVLAIYNSDTKKDLEEKLKLAQESYLKWRKTTFIQRGKLLKKAGDLLIQNKSVYSLLIAREMGKPVTSAIAEIEKSAWVCHYFAENSEKFLQNEMIETEAKKSYVTFQPLGIILAIMPWNFPFNQVFRFAAPALMAGNVGLLKHASNVTGSSLLIEKIFQEAGFPTGVFQSLTISSDEVADIIKDTRVKAVTLTGSEKAGASVAGIAGNVIKKTVLELGGSDPFIICDDADLEKAAAVATTARLMNSGQSCICAKRFIVNEKIADKFIHLLRTNMEKIIIGDPTDMKTQMGPLANQQILDTIDEQVKKSVKLGAKVIYGGKRIGNKGYFYQPTILTNIKKNMPVYSEETFGPVATIFIAIDDNDAIRLANDTKYGLGASVWTTNPDRAEKFIKEIESGSVFVNAQVRSDPRIPFGGIKYSGYGRELSSYGIKEFVNIKTVWVD